MDTLRKLTLLVGAATLALALVAGPALAAEDAPEETPTTEQSEEDGRIALADTPRDRLGLLLLIALIGGGGFAFAGMRRQLKGERSQASGEFRWR